MFKKKYSGSDINKYMSAHKKEINNLYSDKKKMTGFIGKVTNKFNKIRTIKQLAVLVFEVKTIISILKYWINGNYRDISKKTIFVLTGALIYFLSPFDFVFDGIPLLGYIDDMVVISYIFKQVFYEIEKYKNWKSETFYENGILNAEVVE